MLQTISNIGNIPHLSDSDPESNTPSKVNFNYFDIHKFHCSPEINSCSNKASSLLNCNIRSIQANFDNLEQFLNDLNYPFNIISLSETWINRSNEQISNPDLPSYSFLSQPTTQRAGGVGMYIKKGIQYSVRHDLTSSTDESEMLWVEIESDLNSNMICGVVYRHPSSNLETFLNKFYSVIGKINQERKLCLISGDVHSYNTRHASKSTYYINTIKTNYGKFNIRFAAVKVWNHLDESINTSPLKRLKTKSS